MTGSVQLYVQRLEEKLLFAETSWQTVESSLREKEQEVQTMKIELQNNQKAQASEIDEVNSRHNNDMKTPYMHDTTARYAPPNPWEHVAPHVCCTSILHSQ